MEPRRWWAGPGRVALAAVAVAGLAAGCSCEVGEIGDPGDGADSRRLAVEVTPATGLVDGTVVQVRSDAFDEYEIVGVAVCLQEADTEREGVDACDEISGYRYATSPEGRLSATFPVPRVITVGGAAFDCAERPERCLLVAADADDYDVSGGRPISFREDLPPLDDVEPQRERGYTDLLPVTGSPTGPFTGTTRVELAASGFQPSEPVLLARCTDRLADDGPVDSCEPLDGIDAVGALAFRTLPTEPLLTDAEGRITVSIDATPWILPYDDDIGAVMDVVDASGTSRDGPAPEGAVDCTDQPGRCWLVVAAAADTKRSAVLPYDIS